MENITATLRNINFQHSALAELYNAPIPLLRNPDEVHEPWEIDSAILDKVFDINGFQITEQKMIPCGHIRSPHPFHKGVTNHQSSLEGVLLQQRRVTRPWELAKVIRNANLLEAIKFFHGNDCQKHKRAALIIVLIEYYFRIRFEPPNTTKAKSLKWYINTVSYIEHYRECILFN